MTALARFVAPLAVAAWGLAGCAETTANGNGRYDNSRTSEGTMKQAPPNMGSAQSARGKGRAGEHKTMMHHH